MLGTFLYWDCAIQWGGGKNKSTIATQIIFFFLPNLACIVMEQTTKPPQDLVNLDTSAQEGPEVLCSTW